MAHARTPSIRRAPEIYSKEEEDFFRRELENNLLTAVYYAVSVSTGVDTATSLTNKRGHYFPPVGVVTVG